MALLSGLWRLQVDHPNLVRMADRSISSTDLLAHAAQFAERIRGLDRIAVDATPTLETVVGVVGALAAGVAVVPIPPDAGATEREHIIRDSGVDTAFGPPVRASGRPALSTVPIDLTRRPTGTASQAAATARAEPDDAQTAFILYTSGTTGAPKGVVISHGAIAACLDGLADAWAWTADDLLVHGLPLFHVHGLILGVLGPLRIGGRLHHVGRPRPERYAAAQGTLYFAVPTIWSRICADPPAARALRGARLLVSGSAPLPATVFDALRGLSSHRAVERYGMTETLITVAARADGPRRPGTVGTPLPGVQTRLVDDHGGPVPATGSDIGELLVRGPTLLDGYLNRPDVATRDADGWFHTGDLAAIGPDGWHRIVGRASTDLIKSGGYRIGAGEVEDALLAHPNVREAAVVGSPDPDLGQQVTAYVVGEQVTEQELIDFVAGSLSTHKRPRRVHLVAGLPRNALGKVQKTLLG